MTVIDRLLDRFLTLCPVMLWAVDHSLSGESLEVPTPPHSFGTPTDTEDTNRNMSLRAPGS